jgi:hypothetical protein
MRLYFTDLNFYTRTTFGIGEQSKRRLWLFACYLAFALGVFCRQLVDMANFPSVRLNSNSLDFSTFTASFIVGLAIFPFFVRHMRKLADYLSDSNKEGIPAAEGENSNAAPWNLLHVLTSFTTGFFVNLAYDKLVQFIQTQLAPHP